MSEAQKNWRCASCGEKLVMTGINFEYMGRKFAHEVPACPKCGKAFVSKELAQGKMAEVELLMEDK